VNTQLLGASALSPQEEDCCTTRNGSLQHLGHQGMVLQWNMHAPPARTRRRGAPPCASLSLTRNAHSHSWAACPPRAARGKRTLASISQAQSPVSSLSCIKQLTPSSNGKQGHEEDPAHPQPSSSSSHVPQATHSRTLNSCKLLFAGAMSAVVSRTFCAPLERLKMELLLKQGTGGTVSTARHILRHEGITGFWRGNALNVLRTAPFKAVNFCCFDSYHRALVVLSGKDGNTERFTSGAMAGITATVVCFPLDVVRTRLMSRAHGLRYGANPFRTLVGIMKYEGASALYTGCLPAVIGMAPAGAVFYGVYDLCKHRHLTSLEKMGCPNPSIPSGYTLLYGALAGACSELLVYPLEVLRRRLQVQSMMASSTHHPTLGGRAAAAAAAAHAANKASGLQHMQQAGSKGGVRVMHTLLTIIKAEGLQGLYAGMGPNILQVLPSAALSYFTYDTVKQLLGAEA